MAGQTSNHVVGGRYLHGKTGRPVTVRYIGPLPPSTATPSSQPEHDTGVTIWLGIEYDDPAHGKHSGTYKDVQVFECRSEGAGAFLKASEGVLIPGISFVEALEERYGAILPDDTPSRTKSSDDEVIGDRVQLGTSGIVVDAPGMQAVRARVGRLEKLREIGLENEWVSHLGEDEQKRVVMADRLKAVHTVNLSGSLLSSWTEVAHIARHLRGLRTLVLSCSRIAALPADVSEGILRELEGSFAGVQELHLGNAGVNWTEIICLSRLFPALRVLHLHDNPSLRALSDPGTALRGLEFLSLSGSGVKSWDDVVAGLSSLPGLSTLDISRLELPAIPFPSPSAPTFQHLESLIVLSSTLSSWADIDALESWTGGKLTALRFSLARRGPSDSDDEDPESDKIVSKSTETPVDPFCISGRASIERPIFIAKLSSLTVFNSTPITPTERRDAERAYLSLVERMSPGKESTWGRYDDLRLKHGGPTPNAAQTDSESGPPRRSAALKSKMITLRMLSSDSGNEVDMKILPASPVTLLRKKAARLAGRDSSSVSLWTARLVGGVHERVAEIEDGHEVGWWLSDGDVVLIEHVSIE